MKERKITGADTQVQEVKRLYETAFPVEEQIPWNDLLRLTDTMPLDFTAYYDEEQFVGLTIVYQRESLHWFWYFAVQEELRGKGYGQQILSHLLESYQGKPLILDMESPEQPSDNMEQRRRRHGFYLRNGFRDTGVGRTFEGITYTILMRGEGTFTMQDYDEIIRELRRFWESLPEEDKEA